MEMKEFMEQIVAFWNNYWGEGLVAWLLLAAVIWLLLFRRKKETVKYLLFYLAVSLFIFFCPFTAGIIQACIGENVYWRVLWLAPSTPVIAYAMTEFLRERKKLWKPLSLAGCIALIVLCGKGIYQAGNYHPVHNYQKVPDEVAGICNLIKQDAGDTPFMLAADNYIGPYVRVYDPSISMMFNREWRGGYGAGSNRLYLEINAPVFNYRNIAAVGRGTFCNYLVVKIPNEEQKKEMEMYGYQELGTVGRYSVYRLGDSADAVKNPLLYPEEYGRA